MNFLLDTHVFLWFAAYPEKLSDRAKQIILNTKNSLFLSIVSLWEMQIKIQLGKLDIDTHLIDLWHDQQTKSQILFLPAKEEHVWTLPNLPQIHKDPFDRLLIAQSLCENMPFITADATISKYNVKIIW
ncbi:type II toxin-antitoxin system VapC family toxin [Desulfoplanes sp. PS50]|jgi:PIN domain nuclease of toxin-antitoxin system